MGAESVPAGQNLAIRQAKDALIVPVPGGGRGGF